MSGPDDESPLIKHINISNSQSSEQETSIGQWTIKSMYDSQLELPENGPYMAKHSTWEPKEAKAGPLKEMTLPDSLRQENMENYSGEGKEVDPDGVGTIADRGVSASAEEKDLDGSGHERNFPADFELKLHNLSSNDVKLSSNIEFSTSPNASVSVRVNTLSQRQLVEQFTTLPYSWSESETAEDVKEVASYVRNPTENFDATSPLQTTDERRKELITTTTEALMDVLTTSEVTSVDLLARDSHGTDPTSRATSTENTSDSFFTEKPSISILGVHEENENSTSAPDLQNPLLVTLTPTEGSQTGVFQLTTTASGSGIGITEMESRSAISESFVVGSHWTPFKDSKSDELTTSKATESKDVSNPLGSLVPNWAFGLIPSGRFLLSF